MDFPDGSVAKESACNARDLGLIPGLGRSPLGRHGNTLQYSCLENPHRQRSLVGYSPRGHKESDRTEQVSANTHTHTHTHIHKYISLKFSFTRQGTHLSLMDQFNFLRSYAFYRVAIVWI